LFLGRRAEREVLDGMLAAARNQHSATLVIRGGAGLGKSALLDYAVRSAPDLKLVRTVGVESESELAFAALSRALRLAPGDAGLRAAARRAASTTVRCSASGVKAQVSGS